jgi:hypothetical protein
MKRQAAACALAGTLLLAGATAHVVILGLEHGVVAESGATQRFDEFAEIWKSSAEPPAVTIGTDLLPPNLPGPLDTEAGGKPHSVTLRCDVKPGRYHLELALYDTHKTSPPALAITLNGRRLVDLQLRSGEGKPPPYSAINPALTAIVPFTATSTRNTFVITARAGSWLAPAMVRVSSAGKEFNPAKALYLLLARARSLLVLVGLLLGALFFGVCARLGLREGVAAVMLCAASLILTAVLGEVVFREWLIHNPSQRALSTPQERPGQRHLKHYTYMTMVQQSSQAEIPYEIQPNLDGVFANHPLATNSLGMRGPELDRDRRPGTLRVVGIGDSVMMGWGVSYDETALTRIGRLLAAAAGRPVETANLGCPSYNTAVETAVYRLKGRRLKPDLVVVIFMENDFGFPGLMLEPVVRSTVRKSYLREQIRKLIVPFWKEAGEYEREVGFVSTRQFDAMKGKKDEQLTPEERWLKKVQEHYLHMVNESGVRASLKDLADMIREDRAIGVVVYNPIRLTVGDPGSYEKRAGWVVATAREFGLEALDMTPVYESHLRGAGFQRMEQELWVSPSDWHPNAEAHRLIAETVVTHLQKIGALEKGREP